MTYDPISFSENLNDLRLVNDLTFEEFSYLLEIDKASLNKYCRAKKFPSLQVLCKICNKMDVSPDSLLKNQKALY